MLNFFTTLLLNAMASFVTGNIVAAPAFYMWTGMQGHNNNETQHVLKNLIG